MSEYGAVHGITEQFGTDLPETEVAQEDLIVERNAAKFSKTKEYQTLKTHLEQRIEYYKTFLPNGDGVITKTPEELGGQWIIANAIIGEFQAILQAYENARQVVEDAKP